MAFTPRTMSSTRSNCLAVGHLVARRPPCRRGSGRPPCARSAKASTSATSISGDRLDGRRVPARLRTVLAVLGTGPGLDRDQLDRPAPRPASWWSAVDEPPRGTPVPSAGKSYSERSVGGGPVVADRRSYLLGRAGCHGACVRRLSAGRYEQGRDVARRRGAASRLNCGGRTCRRRSCPVRLSITYSASPCCWVRAVAASESRGP